MSANNRKLTVNEIQAVGSILQDKEAIELLKKINDQVVTEEDTKGKRKQNDIFAFVGFAHQDDILGEDPESQEFQEKQGVLRKLTDTGLVDEGFHVPLERKNEKKYGDIKIPASDQKVGKYRISETGLAVLALLTTAGSKKFNPQDPIEVVEEDNNNNNNNIVPDNSKQKKKNNKSKAVAEFKKEIKEENKL
jgi:hypothetical protein